MVYDKVSIVKLLRYAPVTISTFVFSKDTCNFFLDIFVFVFICSVLFVVVIGAARDPGDVNEQRYLKFMP